MAAPKYSRQSEKENLFNWLVSMLGYDTSADLWRPILVGTDGSISVVPAANASTTAATLTQANKTVAATGTPEAIGTGLVESIVIKVLKGRTTANTGNVFIGFSATNDTQLYTLAPGEELALAAPDGKKLDLSGIYIDVATNGDGVIYTAVA